MNPIFLKDFYKVGHIKQYPPGTDLVFSNFTPRKSRMPGVEHSVFFGLRYFMQEYLVRQFNTGFFKSPGYYVYVPDDAVARAYEYQKVMEACLGDDSFPTHIAQLYDLGYLPIAIYALPEGSVVPCGVPALVMHNTHPDFYWLPNMLETLLSCTLWQPCTSATIARQYRLLLDKYAEETSDIPEFVDFQAHDFSMRGMSSVESAILSGMAHLNYFSGTDTIPAILAAEKYYNQQLGICSVPATEHSVMSAGGQETEYDTFERLINAYPTGVLSIVSDTSDLWKVITDYLPRLKDKIMSRDGKIVIRPDSGDPANIICGSSSPERSWDAPHTLGVVECLWEIFGGTTNSKGYKQLDAHIGVIYGDSITLERCEDICSRLKRKGFASTNVVFGIGSYTYQYNTRDTLGWAMKATYCEIHGIGRPITKNPITDDGTKKSHSGLLKVVTEVPLPGSTYKVLQNQTWEEFHAPDNELKLVYKDGKIIDG